MVSTESKRTLSARSNWEKEIARFAPSLRVTTFYGGNRKLQNVDANTGAVQAARAVGPDGTKKTRVEAAADVILTSYSVSNIVGSVRSRCARGQPDRRSWQCIRNA